MKPGYYWDNGYSDIVIAYPDDTLDCPAGLYEFPYLGYSKETFPWSRCHVSWAKDVWLLQLEFIAPL